MSIDIDIIGVGIAAPGLPDWNTFCRVLDGGQPAEASELPKTTLLSPRERRRAPATVRLSFAAAEQACAAADMEPADLEAVFCSGMGDLEITDYMCGVLAENPEMLSPTRFHNSVHNAASGYWSIGAGAHGDVTAISGWRDSATAGVIEALSRVHAGQKPVLLVVYDDVARGPMQDLWACEHAFCSALVMAPSGSSSRAMARLNIGTVPGGVDDWPQLPEMLAGRIDDNAAARMLPLLTRIAGSSDGEIVLGAEQGPGLVIREYGA